MSAKKATTARTTPMTDQPQTAYDLYPYESDPAATTLSATRARQQYREDAPRFPVDPQVFARLLKRYDHVGTHARETLIEECAADLLLACRDLPLRRVGSRLLAWDGVAWREEPASARAVLREWLRDPAALRQYTQEIGHWPIIDGGTDRGFLGISGGKVIGYQEVFRQRVGGDSRIGQELRKWYDHPDRAVKALGNRAPITVDDDGALLREDARGWLNTPGGMYHLADAAAPPVIADAERRRLDPVRVTRATVGTLGDCPDFLAALERALPDADVRDYFQRLMGYAATGLVCEDVVVWCLGEAASGKTTIIGAIQHALGEYAAQASQTALLRVTPKFPHLDELRGVRLAVMSEMDARYQIDTGRFKALSGGNLVECGNGASSWRPQFTMVVESNHMPRFGDTSNGTRRRLRVIPFDVVVPEDERNGSLRDHIRQNEAPGVLAWIIAGAWAYYAHGLGGVPAAVRRASDLVFVQDDPERAFYSMLTPSSRAVPFSRVYDELARMCSRAKRPLPAKRLVSAALRDQGFTVKQGHARQLEVYASVDALAA